jgi:galactokinase
MSAGTTPTAAEAFAACFAQPPKVVASAPGRVNLLGEHTDYNGGLVLPMALRDLGVNVASGAGETPGAIDVYSDIFRDTARREITEAPSSHWSDYVLGAVKAAATDQVSREGIRIALTANVPLGAGLSSSAALEVATLRALAAFYGVEADPVEVAIAARSVENDFVGMPCGIMDQFASSVGRPGAALMLDTRTLDHTPAPSLPGHRFVILHSGVSHKLTEDGYATRVAECRAACAALGVEMLSDLGPDDLDRIAAVPSPLDRRARHIVTENRRVEAGFRALNEGDSAAFGRLMVESHASQRNDYEITVPETDLLVETAITEGALGARQTGGGFGGALVILLATERVEDWCNTMTRAFPATHVVAVT